MKFIVYFTLAVTFIYLANFNIETEGKSIKSDNNQRGLLIVNTIDGTIRAINENDGSEVWKVAGSPHVSQSITNLEYRNDKGQSYRLVPSLEGALFLVEPTAMRPLSFTASDLLASSFQLPDNSLLVGAQETEVVVIDTETGKIVFNCSKEGCDNRNGSMNDVVEDSTPRLIVNRRRNTVRSVDLNTGLENWNFSVSQNELAAHLSRGNIATTAKQAWRQNVNRQDSGARGSVEYTFNVQQGLIIASVRNPFSNVLWQVELQMSLHKVWSLRGGELRQLQIITPGQPLTSAIQSPKSNTRTGKSTVTDVGACSHNSDIFSGRTTSRTTDGQHYIYFGHYRGQLYVQLDDTAAMHLPYPIPPVPDREEIADDKTAVQRPRPHPPTGFYPSGERETAVVEWDDGDSLSVEAYGLSGNPISWWFQSLTFGLFVCVVAHLVILRFYYPPEKAANRPAAVNVSLEADDEKSKQADSGIRLTPSASSTESPAFASASPMSVQFESRYASEYAHIRCLGKGGFGVVFEARNNMDGCSYAIKRVSVKDNNDNYDRLSREVRALARCDHPGVVRYFMAWMERPPPGWQEARDKELNLCDCENPNELNFTSGDTSSTHHTNMNIQTSSYAPSYIPRKRYSDSVEIIFRKPQTFDESSDNAFDFGFSKRTLSRISSYSPDEDGSSSIDEGRESSTSQEVSAIIPLRRRKPRDEDSVEIVFQASESKTRPESGVEEDSSKYEAAGKAGEAKKNVPMLYLYIAMELCASGSLKTWLEKTTNCRPPRAALFKMFAQMVDSVSHVHSCGLMHRDLKPSNIFFSRSDDKLIKVGDFGLVAHNTSQNSSSRDSSLSSSDDMSDPEKRSQAQNRHTDRVGTRLYMSPELEAGRDYDSKVDIFSLGLILLELLVPFDTQMERVQSLCQAKRGILPKQFEQSNEADAKLIKKLLSADPSNRPSCDQILEDPLIRCAYQETMQQRYRTYSSSAVCSGDTP